MLLYRLRQITCSVTNLDHSRLQGCGKTKMSLAIVSTSSQLIWMVVGVVDVYESDESHFLLSCPLNIQEREPY